MTDLIDRASGYTQGVAIKIPCRLATTANITLSGLQSIDGVTTVADDRVLVKNQTDQTENGIYAASSGTWTRVVDFDGSRDVVQGTLVTVYAGSTNAGTMWRLTTANPVTIGTDNITFSENTFSNIETFATAAAASAAEAAASAASLNIVTASLAANDMLMYDSVDARFENKTVAQVQSALDIFTNADEAAMTGGRLRNIYYLTSNGTYTKPAWLKFVYCYGVGAGAGGGGASAGATLGKGGGPGALCIKKIDAASIGATESYTIGAGGAGGNNTPSAGSNGGDTTFGAHFTAGGGIGGSAGNGTSGQSGNPGTATGGDINLSGVVGFPALANGADSLSGGGGHSPYGFGFGFPPAPSTGTKTASGYGGGGGGGYNNESGGNGSSGILIIYEYE